MRLFLTSLTSAMLLLQAVTGWCCHRPVNANLGVRTAPVAACCADCTPACPAKSPATPRHSPQCLGVCTYVLAEKSQIDGPQSVVARDFLLVTSVVDSSLTGHLERSWSAIELMPPLRLHLLHQIILI
jgi:hypothetical protein